MVELEQLLVSNIPNFICLTEIHNFNININDSISYIGKLRSPEDKKGGGLAILWDKNGKIKIEEIEYKHPDILISLIEIGNFSFKLVLVYLDTNDKNRNANIYQHLNKIIDSSISKLCIVGDFNGHTGILGPQDINYNGKKFLEFANNNDLIILNLDMRCEGEITRQQGDIKSTIDFMLVNESMSNSFSKMFIDEDREITNFSDHNPPDNGYPWSSNGTPWDFRHG